MTGRALAPPPFRFFHPGRPVSLREITRPIWSALSSLVVGAMVDIPGTPAAASSSPESSPDERSPPSFSRFAFCRSTALNTFPLAHDFAPRNISSSRMIFPETLAPATFASTTAAGRSVGLARTISPLGRVNIAYGCRPATVNAGKNRVRVRASRGQRSRCRRRSLAAASARSRRSASAFSSSFALGFFPPPFFADGSVSVGASSSAGGGSGSSTGLDVAWFFPANTIVSPIRSFEFVPALLSSASESFEPAPAEPAASVHIRDTPPRSAEHICDPSADHSTLVTAVYRALGSPSTPFSSFSFPPAPLSWSGCALHLARATTTGDEDKSEFLGFFFFFFFASFSVDSPSSSEGSSGGGGNRHTIISPLLVPAARLGPAPARAPAPTAARLVTAPLTSSAFFPSNAATTRTFSQYRRSSTCAARCDWFVGGGSASTPRFATPDLGGGCARAFASASAICSRRAIAAATRRFSSSASESEESEESEESPPLPSEEPLLLSEGLPPPSEPSDPCFFFVFSSRAGAMTTRGRPRPTPGGGDASRRGCVWWNTSPGGRRRCISLSMC